jgi:antitoxin PrlF
MTAFTELAATMSSKGQVVIPSDVRKKLGLTQGSVLRFLVEGDSVRLLPASCEVQRLKGRLVAPSRAVSIDDMNAAIRERRSRAGQV